MLKHVPPRHVREGPLDRTGLLASPLFGAGLLVLLTLCTQCRRRAPLQDACLGITTDAGAHGDALVPYLLQMREHVFFR